MYLSDLLARYVADSEYGLQPSTIEQYAGAIRVWERELAGRRLTLVDIDEPAITAYVDWLRLNRAPETAKSKRRATLTLLRYACREGLLTLDLARIRKLRPHRRCVEAWTLDEVRQLVAAAERLDGQWQAGRTVRRRADWMSTFVRASWDTALRLSDLLSVERDWIERDRYGMGRITLAQHKTGHQHRVRLSRETMERIDVMLGARRTGLIWQLWGSRRQFFALFGRVVASAGIRRGTSKWLRRGSVTSVEAQQRWTGYLHAGHTSPRVAVEHYLDQSQLAETPMPEGI